MLIKSTIEYFINLKQEGSNWDFKREWYSSNKDLLLDIICFANNLVNSDCYIIIGVDEEKDYSITDISKDVNRKNTQNITDFLKDKKFVGGIRPVVTVESLYFDTDVVDVMIIHNSKHTPFYLTEKYMGILPYHIYTRVQDTNTAINLSADINNVEYLWRKRFGLDETPLEKFTEYLKDSDGWDVSPRTDRDVMFYRRSPEYQIVSIADDRDGYEVYHFTQTDPRPHWETVYLYYQQTVLESFPLVLMDGARWATVAPEATNLFRYRRFLGLEQTLYYSYTKGTLPYVLHEFYTRTHSECSGYERFLEVILIFENKTEKDNFQKYVFNNLGKFKQLYKSQDEPYLLEIRNYDMSIFEREYKASLVLKIMLEDFRRGKK